MVNVKSQFLNESLISLNEDIDFNIMKEDTKISTFHDEVANSERLINKGHQKSLARKLVILIRKTVQVKIASTKKMETWETSWRKVSHGSLHHFHF